MQTFLHTFKETSYEAEYVQSAHCTDNGPMEGFWGILKREMYYSKKFTSKGDLITAVESYIRYYNTERIQRKMHLMTPAEFHDHFDAAA